MSTRFGRVLPGLLSAVLVLASGGCKKDADNPVTSSLPIVGPITTGPVVDAGSQLIPASGGNFTVSDAGSLINGLQISVPQNAYAEARTFHVSYAPVQNHTLGPNFNPIAPIITISNGGGYADELMSLRIPAKLPPGRSAMAFYYDRMTGELEGLPTVASDSTSVTIVTRHFSSSSLSASSGFARSGFFKASDVDVGTSDIALSLMPAMEENGMFASDFHPGIDDWGFPGWGTTLAAPRGIIAGATVGAIWYFDEKRPKGSPPLWQRFDNDGNTPKTPDTWQDDVLAYKFCSMLTRDEDWDTWYLRLFTYPNQGLDKGDKITRDLFSYAFFLTRKPQLLLVQGEKGSMVLIAWMHDGGKLFVCDPLYPGDSRRGIGSDANFKFYAYESQGAIFTDYKYIGITSVIDWSKIDQRWREMADKTIGNGVFPTFSMVTLNDDVQFEPLEDGFTKSDGHFTLLVHGNGFDGHFKVINERLEIIATDTPFDLEPGKHRIGVSVYDGQSLWVGFKWVSVTAGEESGFFPLAVGNKWTYEAKRYDGGGQIIETRLISDSVASDLVVNGETWYHRAGMGSATQTGYYANRSDGVWAYVPTGSPKKDYLLYQYPAARGATYQTGVDGKITVKVLEIATSANTYVGQFTDCYQYEVRVQGLSTVRTVWIAPRVGEVASWDTEPDPGGGLTLTRTTVLESYALR